MIRYIKGSLIKAKEGRIIVLAGGVGYEILLPVIVWQDFMQRNPDDEEIELFISYHQTVQQPRPALIGFITEIELEFFELLITVKAIGPVMASRALTLPVSLIARAIEEKDVATIRQLTGLGQRKADMLVSELNGKVGKYALMKKTMDGDVGVADDLGKQVVDVLVKQLGHNRSEATKMVEDAIERMPDVVTPEQLFEEVYHGTRENE